MAIFAQVSPKWAAAGDIVVPAGRRANIAAESKAVLGNGAQGRDDENRDDQ